MGNGAGTTVEWGADFWQRVLISGLGTLGSLVVAILLLLLTRALTRRSDHKKEQKELAWRLVDQLAERRVEFMDEPADVYVDKVGSPAAMKIAFLLSEYQYRLEDPQLQWMCRQYEANVREFWIGSNRLPALQLIVAVKRMSYELTAMTGHLARYLTKGYVPEIERIDWNTVKNKSKGTAGGPAPEGTGPTP